MICFSWITRSSSGDMVPLLLNENNEFLLLGRAVPWAFNLTKCWICGGPMGLSSRPWISNPLEPDQIPHSYSSIQNTTRDNTTPWPVTYPGRGHYCLSRNQSNGIQTEESQCAWTLQLRCSGIQTAATNSPFVCGGGTTPLEIPRKPWLPCGVWT